jgi:hypothetical protein
VATDLHDINALLGEVDAGIASGCQQLTLLTLFLKLFPLFDHFSTFG